MVHILKIHTNKLSLGLYRIKTIEKAILEIMKYYIIFSVNYENIGETNNEKTETKVKRITCNIECNK